MPELIHNPELPDVSIMAYDCTKYDYSIDIELGQNSVEVGGFKAELSLTLEQAQIMHYMLEQAIASSTEFLSAKEMAAAHAERPE